MLVTQPFSDDKFHEECGVFGIYGHPDAAYLTVLGLHQLQHRGDLSAGVVSLDDKKFNAHRGHGEVFDNFNSKEIIEKLTGTAAIGHTRYATTGERLRRNIQPLYAELNFGGYAIAHNGNLTNDAGIKKALQDSGSLFQTTTDTEIITHLVALSRSKTLVQRHQDALKQIKGAYSLLILTAEGLMGVRDPVGVRPLVIGKLDDAFILASETCALDIVGAKFIRDVKPGELVLINDDGLHSYQLLEPQPQRFCVFEFIYFSRPDSVVEGSNVYEVRKNIGKELARENKIEADIVIPVPDSGVPAALGYAAESKIPFELGIIRSHYVGRTFIQPTQQIRDLGVKLKHNVNQKFVEGKRIVLVDDSIVRGTTSMKIVKMLREAGAKEIHMRIASPPTKNPCFYGVDTPKREKLLAANHDIEAMNDYIGCDSLSFISIEGVYRALGEYRRDPKNPKFCDACFTGDYPIRIEDKNI
jgi:amidophosphoribosyltransferase